MAKDVARMLQGKNKVLLFRRLVDQATEASKLVFQTEHTFSYSRSLDRIVTKDGAVVKVGGLEAEVSIEAVQSSNDVVGAMLRESVKDGEKLEIWEVTLDEELKEGETYPAVYAQGFLEEWETGAGAEDEASVSGTFIIELVPQNGMATLTEEQQKAVQYAFRDTVGELE